MNKYCVIARNFKTSFIKRLSEEVGDELAFFNPWEDEVLPKARIYFFRSTAIHGSDLDLKSLSRLPENSLLINPEQSLRAFRTKETQYAQGLHEPFQPIPWLSLLGRSLDEARGFAETQGPVVVKPIRGQQGWGVERLTSETLCDWWKKRTDDEYLLQRFIPGRELRLFFIRDQYLLLQRRGEETANFARGGSAEACELPRELKALADIFIGNSGAFYGAIDLMESGGKFYFLELNLAPGIEQLEAVTGENVIELLIRSLNSVT